MDDKGLDIAAIKEAAESGDSNAQTSLAMCYYQGEVIERDFGLAAFWYTKAAEQGDAGAQCLLGMCYESGEGVEKDTKKALYWYLQSAEQGDDISQGILALYYEIGADVPQDLKKAADWHTKAATQGNARSQFHLGMLYEKGAGVEKDYKTAVHWYTKAANQEDGTAQLYLGRCYENGVGVRKDKKLSDFWYAKAACDIYALESIDKYYEEGNAKDSKYKTAGEWYQAYAADGTTARNYAYFIREVNEEDIDLYIMSVYWYEQSALKGDISSFYQLALMYSFNKSNAENARKTFGDNKIVPTAESIACFVNKFYPLSEKDKNINLNKNEIEAFKKRIEDLTKISRTAGIFSLDEETRKEKNIVLKTGLQMIMESLDAQIINVVLENLLADSNDETKQVILEGVSRIQRGCLD
ncbi:MAG: sel1 repeat family protein [Treponema sp.]|nr:sel1 repeat family protein [Treponema sp.]